MDMFPAHEANEPAAAGTAPGAAAKVAEADQPASVEVVFPHDHG
jgi:hypothetical protein